MKNKYIMALIALILVLPITVNANAAEPTPSLVIIDTALQSSLPIFKDKVAQEVCILDWNSCPNGTKFQEGPGAAVLPMKFILSNGFDHGTLMSSIAVTANPNMKIVFIRIIGNTSTGTRQITYESTLTNALNWVINNKDKYNVKAVAMSQGMRPSSTALDYCSKSIAPRIAIKTLLSSGIPSFFAVGNDRDYQKIDWPSCIDDSIAIGATDQQNEITRYSNYDKDKLDFYALGNTVAMSPDGTQKNVAGTSASTQIAAAQWVALKQAKPLISYNDQYNLIKSTSINTFNFMIANGKLINLQGALNG
jgi:hypothetical protein